MLLILVCKRYFINLKNIENNLQSYNTYSQYNIENIDNNNKELIINHPWITL